MSPENQGVFQLLKKVNFRRILAFYSSRKWGRFGGVWGAAQIDPFVTEDKGVLRKYDTPQDEFIV